jgi:flagellar motility protein MotE (MotC chaperone)
MLGSVFVVSAVLRFGALGWPFPNAVAFASDTGPGSVDLAGPTAPLRTALDEVERLRADLERREAVVAEREQAVHAAQILVEDRIGELAAAEARLSDLLALSDTAAETDLDRLTRVYETMEAEAAAPLFAQMAPSFAAGFLARMSPAASAALLAELDPQTAYAISVVLATRNAAAPTRDASANLETAD